MKKYNEYMNEGLLAAMKPKSKEQIDKAIIDLINNSPNCEPILELLFDKKININDIPKDDTLLAESGKVNYKNLYIIYNLINEMKSLSTDKDMYIDENMFEFTLAIGDYYIEISFEFYSMEISAKERIYNSGEYITNQDNSRDFRIGIDDIESQFKDKMRNLVEEAIKKNKENIRIVEDAIRVLF